MIIRRKHTHNFAVVPNSTANDRALKADTLGVLVYLLAKPADWTVNIADIRQRFGIGRNRVYAILNELCEARYVERVQNRSTERSRFSQIEYHVHDCPMGAPVAENHLADEIPHPQNGDTVKPQQITVSPKPVIRSTVMRKSGNILNTEYTKSSSKESSASDEAGADAPSVSKKIWEKGKDLLNRSPSKPSSSIIGKWLKRVPADTDKEKLLEIIRAAARAGTDDPISYVTAALNKACPLPPDPAGFDTTEWQLKIQAALNTKKWFASWGPPPGMKGCLVPVELITPQLKTALSEKRISL